MRSACGPRLVWCRGVSFMSSSTLGSIFASKSAFSALTDLQATAICNGILERALRNADRMERREKQSDRKRCRMQELPHQRFCDML